MGAAQSLVTKTIIAQFPPDMKAGPAATALASPVRISVHAAAVTAKSLAWSSTAQTICLAVSMP